MNLWLKFFDNLLILGEKKLSKVIVPDKWKDGARNVTEGGGRKINENKLLSKKNRYVFLSFSIFNLLVFINWMQIMELAITL